MSVYISACQRCLERNDALPAGSPSTDYVFWCVRDASCRQAKQGQMGACEVSGTIGSACVQSVSYPAPEDVSGSEAVALSCTCTDCADPKCTNDYVDPSCKSLYTDCGCGGRVNSHTVGNNKALRKWSRGELVCNLGSGGLDTQPTPEQLDMRRKAETLLHRENANTLTQKQKWSRLVKGIGPFGKQGLMPPAVASACQGAPPPVQCSLNTSCDVPKSPIPERNTICMNKSVPLTRYGRPSVVLSSAGTKWPQTAWQPGMAGFPVGKAGSNAVERALVGDGTTLPNASLADQSFRVELPRFPGGPRSADFSRCNRFAMAPLTLTVCVDQDGRASVKDLADNDAEFWWRPDAVVPFDPNGAGESSGEGIKFSALNDDGGSTFRAGSSLRKYEESPCVDLNGVFPPGDPGKPPTAHEPADMSAWCRKVLDDVTSIGEYGLNNNNPSSGRICCGPDHATFVCDSGQKGNCAIGRTVYTGALTWATSSPGKAEKTATNGLPAVPPAMTPWGMGAWKEGKFPSGYPSYSEACTSSSGDLPPVPASNDITWSVPTNTLALEQWARYRGPRLDQYKDPACGQPLTVAAYGPSLYPKKHYDCPAISGSSCGEDFVKQQPLYSKPEDGSKDNYKQYPERLGGTWAPAVFNCPKNQNKLKTDTTPQLTLTADGSYITITWNFGAFCGAHASRFEDLAGAETPAPGDLGYEGGMGAWSLWSPLSDKFDYPDLKRSGLVPELYSFTWYIGTNSLSDAAATDVAVPCFGVVTGRPSTGQNIDPRPTIGAYVYPPGFTGTTKKNTDGRVDFNQAGGGLLNPGGSVVGTRAGGLGLRGCALKPAYDVWGTEITVELCS